MLVASVTDLLLGFLGDLTGARAVEMMITLLLLAVLEESIVLFFFLLVEEILVTILMNLVVVRVKYKPKTALRVVTVFL